MREGGVLAGLPGGRAMGRATRPCCTSASSRAVTPRCTLLTCSQAVCQGIQPAERAQSSHVLIQSSEAECSHGICWVSWAQGMFHRITAAKARTGAHTRTAAGGGLYSSALGGNRCVRAW